MCLVAILAAVLTGSVAAADYKLTLRSPLPTVTGKIWLDGPNVWQNVYIGPVWVEVFNVSSSETTLQRMLCVDLLGQITLNQQWDAILRTGRPSGVVSDHAWDTAVWMAQKNTGWATGGWPSGSQAVQDAAIQVAVWEVIRDDTAWNLDAGSFRLGSSLSGADRNQVASTALAFYNAAAAPAGYASDHPWFDSVNSGQDMVFFIPETQTVIPEASAGMLAPLGIAAIGLVRRKLGR